MSALFTRAWRRARKLAEAAWSSLAAWLHTRTRRGQLERPPADSDAEGDRVTLEAVEPPPFITTLPEHATFEPDTSQVHCRVHNRPWDECTCTRPGLIRWSDS